MGSNFGLNDSLEYLEFSLDSLDAQNSVNGLALNTDWPLFIMPARQLYNIAAIKIIEVQVPFSYYVFNSSNNVFYLTESDGGGAVQVTFPVGNYSSTTVIAPFESVLNAASANGHTYTVTYNSVTMKFTITSNSGGATTFTLTFGTAGDNTDGSLRNELGFYGGPNVSSTGPSPALTSPYVAAVSGPNYLYLNSNALGNQVNMFLPAGALSLGKGVSGPQVAKIPVNTCPGGVIFWQDPDPQKWFDLENLPNLSVLDFFFTLGNTTSQYPLSFNGQNFSIKLGILVNKMVHNDVLGGGSHNDRVFQRCVPRGGLVGRLL